MGAVANLAMELAGTVSPVHDLNASTDSLDTKSKDKKVDLALYKVRFFMAPPTALMTPQILGRIAFFTARKLIGFT